MFIHWDDKEKSTVGDLLRLNHASRKQSLRRKRLEGGVASCSL